MVTILDMVTGELIQDDAPTASTRKQATDDTTHAMIAPRLQTVEEAVAIERVETGMPLDMDLASFFKSC